MDTVMYLLLSILDSLAALVLMFKLFRFPMKDYVRGVLLVTLVISAVSYIIRNVLDVPVIDPFVQFIIYLVYLRYILIVRWRYSLLIATAGYLLFTNLQMILIALLYSTGLITLIDATFLHGLGTYLIQISSEIACFIVAFLLYRYNSGFSFILEPPHDVYMRHKLTRTDYFLIFASIFGAGTLLVTLYFILNYQNFLLVVIPNCTLAVILIVYFSNRKDYAR